MRHFWSIHILIGILIRLKMQNLIIAARQLSKINWQNKVKKVSKTCPKTDYRLFMQLKKKYNSFKTCVVNMASKPVKRKLGENNQKTLFSYMPPAKVQKPDNKVCIHLFSIYYIHKYIIIYLVCICYCIWKHKFALI